MKSLIFDVVTKLLRPILWIVAIWLLLRGHNAPGGGFVAGLVAGSAVLLKILSTGWKSLDPRLRNNLFESIGIGLAICLVSGMLSVTIGNPFMTGRWFNLGSLQLGTPVLFDMGVFIVVFAVSIICAGYLLEEEDEEVG